MTMRSFGRVVPIHIDMLQLAGYALARAERDIRPTDTDAEYLRAMQAGRAALRAATGQDLGYDLAAWRAFLMAAPDDEFGYRHPYAFSGADRAVRRAIRDQRRTQLVEQLVEPQGSPMVRTEAVAETWAALRTDVTRIGDSCFVSNLAISKLQRHQGELPAAIESVINSPEFETARQSEWLIERNESHLLLVYFEQASAYGWDTVPFLRSLRGPVLHEALVAVFQLWGPTRGANRLRIMPRTLYETWHVLAAQDPDWVGDREALSGYRADGSLVLI